ncbi:MAG: hypothetical protein HY660_06520 [Armatimonadetes bacterium]|nr:hypothetical protein [Armatimonadota bacterium]
MTAGRDIPFPQFDMAAYRALAQDGLAGYGSYPFCGPAGCYFSSAADFSNYVDSEGGVISGLFFIEDERAELTGKRNNPNKGLLVVNGTIIVYRWIGSTVQGRIKIITGTYLHTAREGEPALLAGGSICTDNAGAGGSVTIRGCSWRTQQTPMRAARDAAPAGSSSMGPDTQASARSRHGLAPAPSATLRQHRRPQGGRHQQDR